MGSKDLQCINTLTYSVSTILTPHGWGRRKKFEIKALRWLENAILGLIFVNTVFYKSAILLIFEAEVTEKTSSRIQSLLKAHHGQRKIFTTKVLRWLENAVLRLVFANTVFYKRDVLLIFEAEFIESVV